MDSNKERIEDLASLFLPDLLRPSTVNSSPSNATSPHASKSEDYDMGSVFLKDSKLTNAPSNSGLPSSFQEFLSNNNFINRSNDMEDGQEERSQQQPQQYSHHYNGYMPFEMNPSVSQHMMSYNPGMQLMFQQPNNPQQQSFLSSTLPGQQQMVSNFPRTGSYAKYPGEYDEWFASTNSSITNLNGLYQQQLLQLQALQPTTANATTTEWSQGYTYGYPKWLIDSKEEKSQE